MLGGNFRQFLVRKNARQRLTNVLIERTPAAAVIDEQETAGLQMDPQRLDFGIGELRFAVSRQIQEREIGNAVFLRIDRVKIEIDRDPGVERQMPQPLVATVGVGIPVSLMAQLCELKLLAGTVGNSLNFHRDRLHFPQLADGGDVTDDVDAEPQRIAGEQSQAVRMGVFIPAAAHVPRGEDDGGAAADVHPHQFRRALKVVLHSPLERAEVDRRVIVIRAEDRMIDLQQIERPIGEHLPDFIAERGGKFFASAAGVSQQRAAIEDVLLERFALFVGKFEDFVAANVQDGDFALLLRLIEGDDLVQAQRFPAVPQTELVTAMPHQIVDVAGIGVPVLRCAVFEFRDHEGRGGFGFRLAASERRHRERQRRESLGGRLSLRILARRRAARP